MREPKIAAALLFGVCLFQIALALGAPWGSFTQGGFDTGVLETTGRITAGVSTVLLAVMAQVTLAAANIGAFKTWNSKVVRVLTWISTGYSGIGILMNLISPSLVEKLIWVPVTAAVFVLQLRTLLKTKATKN